MTTFFIGSHFEFYSMDFSDLNKLREIFKINSHFNNIFFYFSVIILYSYNSS